MPEYIFKGELTLSGVDFWITADNLEDAEKKAKLGEHDDWEIGGASSSDWKIDENSGEENV